MVFNHETLNPGTKAMSVIVASIILNKSSLLWIKPQHAPNARFAEMHDIPKVDRRSLKHHKWGDSKDPWPQTAAVYQGEQTFFEDSAGPKKEGNCHGQRYDVTWIVKINPLTSHGNWHHLPKVLKSLLVHTMMKRRRLMEEPTAPAADRVDPLEDLKNLKSIGALLLVGSTF